VTFGLRSNTGREDVEVLVLLMLLLEMAVVVDVAVELAVVVTELSVVDVAGEEEDEAAEEEDMLLAEVTIVVQDVMMLLENVPVDVIVVDEVPCVGSRKLTPRPRPRADSIAITAPTAICLASCDMFEECRMSSVPGSNSVFLSTGPR
jgi:hypothetical protein